MTTGALVAMQCQKVNHHIVCTFFYFDLALLITSDIN